MSEDKLSFCHNACARRLSFQNLLIVVDERSKVTTRYSGRNRLPSTILYRLTTSASLEEKSERISCRPAERKQQQTTTKTYYVDTRVQKSSKISANLPRLVNTTVQNKFRFFSCMGSPRIAGRPQRTAHFSESRGGRPCLSSRKPMLK